MPPAAEAPASVVDTIALARSHRLTNDDAACMEPGPSSPRVASHAIPGATPGGSSRMVNVHQAKTQLSRLIDAAHAGETIVLAKAEANPGPGSCRWNHRLPSASQGGCGSTVP